MSTTITISGIDIEFPSSGDSPDWAEALTQFALAVEAALQVVAGAFDIPPQTLVIDSFNTVTDEDIPGLSFPSSDVRAAMIKYTVHRATDSAEANEVGMLWVVYNDTNGEWDISEEHAQDGSISFSITDTGQVQFSTTALSGIDHEGFITFTAQALENN